MKLQTIRSQVTIENMNLDWVQEAATLRMKKEWWPSSLTEEDESRMDWMHEVYALLEGPMMNEIEGMNQTSFEDTAYDNLLCDLGPSEF